MRSNSAKIAGPGESSPSTMAEAVYGALRHQILHSELSVGLVVSEGALAETHRVSAATIRVAAQRLASEGLVSIEPRRGIVISSQSIQDVLDLFQIRIMLERSIVRQVAGNLRPEQVNRLRANLDEYRTTAETSHAADTLSVDFEFHRLLCGFSGNRHLVMVLDRILDALYREVRPAQVKFPRRIWKSVRKHEEVAEALLQKDAERAEGLMTKHLQFGEQFVLSRRETG